MKSSALVFLAIALLAPLLARAATDCDLSSLAPFYPVGSDSLDPQLTATRLVSPEPPPNWHIYLDDLDWRALDSRAQAALALSRHKIRPDSCLLDSGIIEGVVEKIAQSAKGGAIFKLTLDARHIWAHRGFEPHGPGPEPVEILMLGNLGGCPDRREVYHPYPCLGDTIIAKTSVCTRLFDGCLCTFEHSWLLLHGLSEGQRARLRAKAAGLVGH